jgi:hypothetical protein
MPTKRHISVWFAMLLAAGSAAAQSHDGDWVSYRDAYRAMVVFEKYGKPKQLLQSELQVSPREKGASLEGLRLTLVTKASQLNLPLDATGRAVFPWMKAAYDENAVLVLNQKAGMYRIHPRVSIALRADGVYEAAELRVACEQALAFQRYLDPGAYRDKKCVAVRFSFPHGVPAVVRLRRPGPGGEAPLPVAEAPAFPDEAGPLFSTVTYRFGDAGMPQVVTPDAPLAIAAVFE